MRGITVRETQNSRSDLSKRRSTELKQKIEPGKQTTRVNYMAVKKSFAQMLSVLEIYQITILINSEFVSAQGRSHTSRLIFSVLTQTEEKK